MAFAHTLQVPVFVLVAFSFVGVSYGCSRYSSSCGAGEVCCLEMCLDGSNCVNRYCNGDSDCASGESCCNNICRHGSNCIGSSCYSNAGCKATENCCRGRCQNYYYCDNNPTPLIVGLVVGSLILACLVSVCIFRVCQRQTRFRPGRVIVGGRVRTTVTTGHTQAYQSYPVGPQHYQQGYQYYPPNQYQEHQTAAHPSYNQGAASQPPPPPYNTAGHANSGVYTPQSSYGAVQTYPV